MSNCGHFRFTSDTPGIDEYGLGLAAMMYARLGFAVLPLDRGGKRPHRMLGREGGVYNATTGSGQILGWWKQDPAANIGVATGSRSKLAVVDIDVKNADGRASWDRFGQETGLHWPYGPYVTTPSGGYHMWVRIDDEVPERPGILPGVDVKGDGGLVVAPPSHQLVQPDGREGGRTDPIPVPYTWAGCPCEAPAAPPWLLSWLASAPASGQPGAGSPAAGLDSDELIAHGAPVGERNATYYRLACKMYRTHGTQGPGAAYVLDTVMTAWRNGDTSGMPEREIRVICESARRFIAKQVAHEEELYQRYSGWFRQ